MSLEKIKALAYSGNLENFKLARLIEKDEQAKQWLDSYIFRLEKIAKKIGTNLDGLLSKDSLYWSDELFIPLEIFNLKQLTSISFYNCPDVIPEEIQQLVLLESFHLYRGKMNNLKKCLDWMNQLRYLSISHANLESLPENLGDLKNLNHLSLTNCQIKRLPSSFHQLNQLQSLYLNENSLTRFPQEILQLTELRELDLTKNKIREVPKEIQQLTKLTKLRMTKNPRLPVKNRKLVREWLPNCDIWI